MAVPVPVREEGRQLGLYEQAILRARAVPPVPPAPLCAGCRAKEARYGFQEGDHEARPRTLCFECFRMELDYRRRVTVQLARGWNGRQRRLPLPGTLPDTLEELTRRRRRAQIVARYTLGLR